MAALSQKIKELNFSHVYLYTWLLLLLLYYEFMNTLITPILTAVVSTFCISIWVFYYSVRAQFLFPFLLLSLTL